MTASGLRPTRLKLSTRPCAEVRRCSNGAGHPARVLRGAADWLRALAEVRPRAEHQPTVVPKLEGRFEVIRPLGRGGFGLVFLARDPRLGRLIAVKLPRPDVPLTADLWRRFVREGKAAASLDHQNIVPVHETGEDAAAPYIASAFVAGPSLAQWLRSKPPAVSPTEAAGLIADLADGLAHAHSRGVLHRDLKPGNVLLQQQEDRGQRTEDGNDNSSFVVCPLSSYSPKLTDFGLARITDDLSADTCSTAYIGTPSYMAPEQARGQVKEIGIAADIYGLGAILYELLAGRPPFQGQTDTDTLRQIVTDEPASLRRQRPDVPVDLEAACRKCLEKNPAARYPTAAALADDLRRFLDGRPTLVRPLGRCERVVRWARRRPEVAGLAGLAGVAVLVAIIVGGWMSVSLAIARAETRAAGEVAATQEYYATLERVKQRRNDLRPGWTRESLDDLRRATELPPAAERLPELRTEAAACLAGVDPRPVKTFSEDFAVYNIAYSPDGRQMALGCYSPDGDVGRIRLVNPDSGRLLRELAYSAEASAVPSGQTDGCRRLTYSPDGRWLVGVSNHRLLHRWDLASGASKAVTWRPDAGAAAEIGFGAVRPLLFGSGDTSIQCWDPADGWKEIRRWEGNSISRPAVDPVTGRIALGMHRLPPGPDVEIHLLDGATSSRAGRRSCDLIRPRSSASTSPVRPVASSRSRPTAGSVLRMPKLAESCGRWSCRIAKMPTPNRSSALPSAPTARCWRAPRNCLAGSNSGTWPVAGCWPTLAPAMAAVCKSPSGLAGGL